MRSGKPSSTQALYSELTAGFSTLRSVEWQFWAIAAISVAAMIFVRSGMPLWYGGSDHSDYYWFGRFILGDRYAGFPIPANWRTPGMGIFHILAGTILFDTWRGFTALLIACGVAIPMLIYAIVRAHSKNFALAAALVTVLSMIPFVYTIFAGSDEVYFFLHTLLLFLCVHYFQRFLHPGFGLLLGIVCVAAYGNMVRPVGALIFWIFIALALMTRPRDRRRLVAASGIYVMLMVGWVLWDRAYGTNGGAGPALGYPLPNELATTPERRLAEAYFSPSGLAHVADDKAAESYPHSQKLRALLREFLNAHPNEWQSNTFLTPPSLFANYAAMPNPTEHILDALFSDRNTLYFGFIVRTVLSSLGHEAGLSLIHDVATEHGTTGLSGVAQYFLERPSLALLGATSNQTGRSLFGILFRVSAEREAIRHHLFTIENVPNPLLSPDLGPANALILRTVRLFIEDYPQYRPGSFAPEEFYRLVTDGDTALLPAGFDPEGFIYLVVNWYLGPSPTGRLYSHAAVEILQRYPKLAMLTYENFLNSTFVRRLGDVAAPLDRKALDLMSDAYFDSRAQVTEGLTPGLTKGLAPVVSATESWKNACALQMVVYLIAPGFILLLIAAFPFLCGPAVLMPCLFLLLDYGYEVATISVFTPYSAIRYEANFYLLPFVISCMLFGQAASTRKQKPRGLSSAIDTSSLRSGGRSALGTM
jgi:hypothetical protein